MENQFLYKAWANSELLEQIKKIDKNLFPEQRRLSIRYLNHTLVVDKIFIAHIKGENHFYEATNTENTPAIDELHQALSETDSWLIQYVKSEHPSAFERELDFQFTDGDAGRMTIAEILNHLIIHGAYHRGNVGMLLTECGIDRPKDTFTRFLHQSEPNRRLTG